MSTAAGLALSVILLSMACARADDGVTAPRDDLAPNGTLRAGVSIINPVLAIRDTPESDPRGVAVDVAREIGRRLNVPVEFVPYTSAAVLGDAAAEGAWDIAFLAADPDRADRIAFSDPYLELEAAYLVPAGSRIQRIEDVDVAGTRIAARPRSAYDLFLRRNLQQATLVYPDGSRTDVDLVTSGEADVLAGLRGPLLDTAATLPGSRVLDGNFAFMQQAIGVPAARAAAVAYLDMVVAELKASGFLENAIARTGARGARVAGEGQ